MSQRKRDAIEDAIERLLAILDSMENNPDDEDGGDIEPYLGWTVTGATGGNGRGDDLEINEVAA